MRTIKKIAFLDRFYKRYCCGAKNHPSGWRKDKRITNKITRQKLKDEVRNAESEEYIEQRLENYNNLLKSGILDCITEKPQESEDKT